MLYIGGNNDIICYGFADFLRATSIEFLAQHGQHAIDPELLFNREKIPVEVKAGTSCSGKQTETMAILVAPYTRMVSLMVSKTVCGILPE